MEVLKRLNEAGLKLAPKKCHLFQRSVKFLGHMVSEEGVLPDPEKVEAVKNWGTPKNVTDVRSFIGTASYYRRFIKKFAQIARPLHQIMEKNRVFDWTKECQEAFDKLKTALSCPPVLSYPDVNKRFILDTDASGLGISGIISQVFEDGEHPVSYFSRGLSKGERNYCITRLELLAVIDSIKHFHHYLYGNNFLIRTDHSALNWIKRFKTPEGQLARWIESLETYDYTIQHRAGK